MKPRRSVVGRTVGPRPKRQERSRTRARSYRCAIIRLRVSLRIGQVDGDLPTRSDHAFEQRLPAGRGLAVVVGLGLLERVVDRDRDSRLSATRERARRRSGIRPRRIAWRRPCRRGGTGWRRVLQPSAPASSQSRSGWIVSKRPPKPDVEEVRQIRVANVVVVRRIGADQRPPRSSRGLRRRLDRRARRPSRQPLKDLRNPRPAS